MKVKVKDLKPNPFRQIDKYPIDEYKVESLMTSIKETSFWDNILARQTDDGYEIAYGHHRLVAIQKVGLKEVDIPIKDLDNATMIKIMANENLEDWKLTPFVIDESVRVAHDFLKSELIKYKNWNHVGGSTHMKSLFSSASQFENCKKHGIGKTIILKFLGGNWKEYMVKEALVRLQESEDVRKAIDMIGQKEEGQKFTKEIKKIEKEKDLKIPDSTKKKIVQKFIKEKEKYQKQKKVYEKKKKQIIKKEKKEVEKQAKSPGMKQTTVSPKPKFVPKITEDIIKKEPKKPDIKLITKMEATNISEEEAVITEGMDLIGKFSIDIHSAYRATLKFKLFMNNLNKKYPLIDINKLKQHFITQDIIELQRELKEILKFFGYEESKLNKQYKQIGG